MRAVYWPEADVVGGEASGFGEAAEEAVELVGLSGLEEGFGAGC
jgi:hypothetical protein